MPRVIPPVDNGNIAEKEVIDPTNIHVEIRKDNNNSEHSQWFNFTLEGTQGDRQSYSDFWCMGKIN